MSLHKALKQFWTVDNRSTVLDRKFYIHEELERVFRDDRIGTYFLIALFIVAMAIGIAWSVKP